jgi:hypothetical protein
MDFFSKKQEWVMAKYNFVKKAGEDQWWKYYVMQSLLEKVNF